MCRRMRSQIERTFTYCCYWKKGSRENLQVSRTNKKQTAEAGEVVKLSKPPPRPRHRAGTLCEISNSDWRARELSDTTTYPSFYCTSEPKSIAVAAAHINHRNLSSDPTRQNTQLKWVTQTSRPASGDSSRSAVSSSSAPASTPRSSPLLSRSSITSAYVNSSDRYPERIPTSKYTHPHKTHLRTLFTPIATCAQDEQTISKSARLTVYEIGPCRGSFLRPQGCRPPPLRLPLGSLFDPHRH
jgi:hypothetical protein